MWQVKRQPDEERMSEVAAQQAAGPPQPYGVEHFRARLAQEAQPAEIAPEPEAELLDAASGDEGAGQSDLTDESGPADGEEGALADAAESEAGQPESEAAQEARDIEVLIDGERVSVSEDEARLGYMRTADYTRKTQILADQRRSLAQEAEELQYMPQFYDRLADQMVAGFDQIDWSRLTQEQHMQLMAAKDAREKEANELRATARGFQERVEEVRKAKRQQEIAQAREILPATIPNWGDELYSQTLQYAIDELGFSREEALNTTDHRQVRAWHKAMTLDQSSRRVKAQMKAETATEPARPAKPRPAQSGREPRPDGRLRAAQMRHAKAPSRKTHLDVISERLALERQQKGR